VNGRVKASFLGSEAKIKESFAAAVTAAKLSLDKTAKDKLGYAFKDKKDEERAMKCVKDADKNDALLDFYCANEPKGPDIGPKTQLASKCAERQAAKLFADPADYAVVIAELKQHQATTIETRRRLAQKVDLELLALFAKADCLGRTGEFDCSAMDWFLERARALGVEHEPPKPLVLGRYLLELGMTPGPEMGELLRRIYERQLDGGISTIEEARAEACRILGIPA